MRDTLSASSDPLLAGIAAASSYEELTAAIEPCQGWQYVRLSFRVPRQRTLGVAAARTPHQHHHTATSSTGPPSRQAPEHDAGITRAKKYVAGSDSDVLTAYYVYSFNEWRIKQERVLVLTRTAFYRVTYDQKTGRIDHYHKSPLDELRAVEKTANGLKIYSAKQVAYTPPLLVARPLVAAAS